MFKEFFGELIGAFILVFIGCSTVALAVTTTTFHSLFEVALVWAVGVALAIYASRKLSSAHLNPAVTIGFVLAGHFPPRKILLYWIGQTTGAVLAGWMVLVLFDALIVEYETMNSITRGATNSYKSAVMFGEFFPNPGYEGAIDSGWIKAMLFEGVGTFVLMTSIFIIIYFFRNKPNLVPLLIGAVVGVLIIFVAPYTQAGFNPARDFGPRLVAFFNGWGDAAFPRVSYSFFTVYIMGPILGAGVAGILSRKITGK